MLWHVQGNLDYEKKEYNTALNYFFLAFEYYFNGKDDDIDTLKQAMNNVRDREEYGKPINIHKKLDWANLRVSKDYIAYVIEWHDRLWPGGEIGFKAEIKSN